MGPVETTFEDALGLGVQAFEMRMPDGANPFATANLRGAWLIGWRFAEAKAERDGLQRDVWALERTVAEMGERLDRLEVKSHDH